jgi:hypothetical protein
MNARLSILCVIVLFSLSTQAHAQNTGGIFPPMVDVGHASLQYRITYDTTSSASAQRLHYQQSINDDLMWRVLAQVKHPTLASSEFHYAQAELFLEFSKQEDPWKTGLRFDARVRDAGNPAMVGLHWTHQIALAERWHVRGVALSSYDIGTTEVGLQTRGSLFTNLAIGPTVGVEFYNAFGTTSNFKTLEEQKHQIGPFAFIPMFDRWNLFLGLLAGVTPASAPFELRSWVTVNF